MSITKFIDEELAEEATIDDVIAALANLASDFGRSKDSWENPSVDRYLEAMGAWLEDVRGRVGEKPSWRLVLMMLQVAKYYE